MEKSLPECISFRNMHKINFNMQITKRQQKRYYSIFYGSKNPKNTSIICLKTLTLVNSLDLRKLEINFSESFSISFRTKQLVTQKRWKAKTFDNQKRVIDRQVWKTNRQFRNWHTDIQCKVLFWLQNYVISSQSTYFGLLVV